jgi:hypothetical protein
MHKIGGNTCAACEYERLRWAKRSLCGLGVVVENIGDQRWKPEEARVRTDLPTYSLRQVALCGNSRLYIDDEVSGNNSFGIT